MDCRLSFPKWAFFSVREAKGRPGRPTSPQERGRPSPSLPARLQCPTARPLGTWGHSVLLWGCPHPEGRARACHGSFPQFPAQEGSRRGSGLGVVPRAPWQASRGPGAGWPSWASVSPLSPFIFVLGTGGMDLLPGHTLQTRGIGWSLAWPVPDRFCLWN